MKSLALHFSPAQENHLFSTTTNNSYSNYLPTITTCLNRVNNSSLNLYGDSMVERSAFSPQLPTIQADPSVATMPGHAITHVNSAFHRPVNINSAVSGVLFPPDIPPIPQVEVRRQGLQIENIFLQRDESTTCYKMTKGTGKRSVSYINNLCTVILMLSRAGIDIPDGISPHTIYLNYTREKRRAAQMSCHFNKADFQHRINCKAKGRLLGLIKKYNSNPETALSAFSALHSSSAQKSIVELMRQKGIL